MLMSSSAAIPIPSPDVIRGRLLPATEVAAPPCCEFLNDRSVGALQAPLAAACPLGQPILPRVPRARLLVDVGMNGPEARRWNKFTAQYFADCTFDYSAVSPSIRRRFKPSPRLSTGLEARQPDHFLAHSQHSTSPSQRLFIGKYSRCCCISRRRAEIVRRLALDTPAWFATDSYCISSSHYIRSTRPWPCSAAADACLADWMERHRLAAPRLATSTTCYSTATREAGVGIWMQRNEKCTMQGGKAPIQPARTADGRRTHQTGGAHVPPSYGCDEALRGAVEPLAKLRALERRCDGVVEVERVLLQPDIDCWRHEALVWRCLPPVRERRWSRVRERN